MCGDGTGEVPRSTRDGRVVAGCPRIPLDLCHGRCEAGVGLSDRMAHHTAYRSAVAPRLATGRPGSLPSPWHGKVDESARAAVNMLGRVWLCAHGSLGTLQGHLSVCGTLSRPCTTPSNHSCVPDFGPFSAKFATSELRVFGVWRWNGED